MLLTGSNFISHFGFHFPVWIPFTGGKSWASNVNPNQFLRNDSHLPFTCFECGFTHHLSVSAVGKTAGELRPLKLHLIFLPDECAASQ